MFSECHNLVVPPDLCATQLSIECYHGMFCWCTSLRQTPLLMASTIEEGSCQRMFYGCTSLVTSPLFLNFQVAKKAIINQQMLEDCPIQFININNKLYDINVLKLL